MRSRSQAWSPKSWASIDFLIIDEIGTEGEDTTWAVNAMTRLISSREDHALKSLLATSNSNPKKLRESLNGRLYTRLGQMAWSRPIAGPCWRDPLTSEREVIADDCPI